MADIILICLWQIGLNSLQFLVSDFQFSDSRFYFIFGLIKSCIMYSILLSLHNILRWIILFFLVLNLIRHFAAINKPFNGTDKQLGLWLMIAAHITFLIGLYQWFAGMFGFQNLMNKGVSAVMQNSEYRFFAIEHTAGMIIAIALITFARGIYRKELTDGKKHRRCITLYLLSLVIILASIPWPGMEQIGRPLFRGF